MSEPKESPEPDVERPQPVQKSAPPPPPDGGLTAWLQVAGAFFLFFNSWGIINTFGVYQTYYEDTLLPGHSASTISGSAPCKASSSSWPASSPAPSSTRATSEPSS
ncbi:hypothetical protein BJX70DRAFT_375748 [Aspergillus crustosus]